MSFLQKWPLLVFYWVLSGSRGLKRRGRCFRFFGAFESRLKPTRRVRVLRKGHFSLHGPMLPTRSMWQFWASETLQKRLSNASVALQKRLTSILHVHLDVFIHCERFHGHGARRWPLWSTTSACASVHDSNRVRPLTPDLPPYISYTLS
jgi:hypothetical protein